MGQAEFKGEAVDQRLECRPGRALGPRHVDVTIALGGEQARPNRPKPEPRRCLIGDDDADRDLRTELGGA